ncbi:MAG: hypothetical protein EA382_01445 [Spirochaetaceae bacterium]|nr:MAG: hypothetical protein EA382_01445 [Spirochaetaceae bacterium]
MNTSKLERAQRSIDELRPRAEADPMRPVFHFHPRSRWMNDPNGTIYVDGYYHLFYQLNPYGDAWGSIHWGHARTRDFTEWEHLPIALAPDGDEYEHFCYSGCAVVPEDGPPRIFYTSVSADRETHPHTQRSAVGTADLVSWHKGEPPTLTLADAPTGTRADWRDPYVFEHDGRHFMVVAAVIPHDGQDRAAVLLYRAEDRSLDRWSYVQPLHLYEEEVTFAECPNLFRIGERWVLIVSPFGPLRYAIGADGDPPDRFAPDRVGIVDYSAEYYATNTFLVDGRVILVAWIRGFPKGRGWNGCLSIPRELGISTDGDLIQTPIEEVRSLRTRGGTVAPEVLRSNRVELGDVPVRGVEIEGTLRIGPHGRAAIRLSSEEGPLFSLEFDGATSTLHAEGIPVRLDPERSAEQPISFRVFVDRSVVEAFIDGGRRCVTRVAENLLQADRLVLETDDGAGFGYLHYWEMIPIEYRDWDTSTRAQ